MFNYYEVKFMLQRPMLGTCTETSIYNEHVLQKAKKEIKAANRLGNKVTKALDKYKGDDISESKEVEELKGVIRTYQELLGKKDTLSNDPTELLEYAKEMEEEYNELVSQGESSRATVFMRGEDGMPVISTHMILGNLKENIKIMVNNGDKSILKYKVSVGEVFALDVKSVDEFMTPDKDIMRKENGERELLERPLKFERMGKIQTAIAISEQLPVGTQFSTILRVRDKSPIDEKALNVLLSFGKSNGFGAWRSSGGMGAYVYKLKLLPDYVEALPEGWS